MTLRMEPGMVYKTWAEFKEALDAHCEESKCLFNVSNAKTVEQANRGLKKPPYFDIRLKYAACILVCKHFGSYTSMSTGLRPKQRTYKTNCKAYINVSACRKENYLIIRDACHLHSHPCTAEMYYSYPEVRRMTKDEQKIVGTLMELGVPTAQIKSVVGRRVTQKDLQNAKLLFKSSNDDMKLHEAAKDTSIINREIDKNESLVEEPTNSGEGSKKFQDCTLSTQTLEDQKVIKDVVENSNNGSYIVAVTGLQDGLEVESVQVDNSQSHGHDDGVDKREASVAESDGLSGLLAAAGINSDSVVVAMNNQTQVKEEQISPLEVSNAYTVTVCLPSGDVSKKGNNLQELLKGLPLGKIISKSSSSVTSVGHLKAEENSPHVSHKLCSQCGGYISPLDGHDRCLSCLGPEHIKEEDCSHCKAMTPEQFNIRRKKMVALRMKALKALQQKRRGEEERKSEEEHQSQNQNDEHVESDSDSASNLYRRSKRARKPRSFGPDVSIEYKSTSKRRRVSVSPERNDLKLETAIKKEPCYDSDSSILTADLQDISRDSSEQSERFAHILSQATVLDNVTISENDAGSQVYLPTKDVTNVFETLVATRDLPAIPSGLKNKYKLDSGFEAQFCTGVEDMTDSSGANDPSVAIMGKGLSKLVTNAATNARLAVYDKLFTRLGVGMADEALSILTELYGKVTQVTEISQEDLTSNLQTAMDTIQALKDVLEELDVMSKDAALTAAYQRSISLNSLEKARASQKQKIPPPETKSPRRGKFTPFSMKRLKSFVPVQDQETVSLPVSQGISSSKFETESQDFKPNPSSEIVVSSSIPETSTSAELPLISMTGSHSSVEVTEQESTFISMAGKIYSVPSMAISTDLLQTLSSAKESIIENVNW